MANAKFSEGAKVRVSIDGRSRLGRITQVVTGTKTGRRLYNVVAESNGTTLGTFRSDDLVSR